MGMLKLWRFGKRMHKKKLQFISIPIRIWIEMRYSVNIPYVWNWEKMAILGMRVLRY